MSKKLTPHIAAAVLAMGLSPVIAQNSATVTGHSPSSGKMDSLTITGGGFIQVAKKDFNRMSPTQISTSIPEPMSNLEQNPYHLALRSIHPALPAALRDASQRPILQLRHAKKNVPFLVAGDLPADPRNSKIGPSQFLSFYHDLNGEATGRTINVRRTEITSEENLKALQSDGAVSKFAQWHGAGKYLLNGFAADRNGEQHAVTPVDPYAYLEHAKFGKDAKGRTVLENEDDPAVRSALTRCDPRYFGLPLDPAEQPTAATAQPNGAFAPLGPAAPAAMPALNLPNLGKFKLSLPGLGK